MERGPLEVEVTGGLGEVMTKKMLFLLSMPTKEHFLG